MASGDEPKIEPFDPLSARTLHQTDEGLDQAVRLSTVADADQHTSAPRIPGYALQGELGRGSYGQVWRGVQKRTRKEVAIKVFLQRGGLDWLFLQREVERLTRLDRHPHIVTLLDTDLENEPPFYAMDLIEGGSLEKYVDANGPAPLGRAMRWLKQVGEALVYVHGKGLIHCDLKPANILVDEQENVRVVDFGQSRVFTESAASLGTLFYMAPEQASVTEAGKPAHPDVRWDVYALGATFYAILTGRPPRATDAGAATLQRTETLHERLDAYRELLTREPIGPPPTGRDAPPVELWEILRKCLSPDPGKRYETVTEVLGDVEALEQNRPISPLAGSRVYRARKFVQRNPFKIVFVLAVLVSCTTLFARKVDQDRALANDIMTGFFESPKRAVEEADEAGGLVESLLRDQCEKYLSSPAAPQRQMGARAALIVSPEAFWEQVDGGRLWRYGEWLDVLSVDFSQQSEILGLIAERASNGSDRQKYVAFCLLGYLTGEGGSLKGRGGDHLNLCERAIDEEKAAGVVAAARYAAKRLGREIPFPNRDPFLVDDLTGLTFVRIPEMADFRRGSDPTDPYRYPDEDRPENGVHVGGVYFCVTELTYLPAHDYIFSQAIEPHYVENPDALRNDEGGGLRDIGVMFDTEIRRIMGLRLLNKLAADDIANWLTQRALKAGSKHQYRLPSEEEWEFACRGGNLESRFCYGDDPVYASYFMRCRGAFGAYHAVGAFMPNWYGLSDMHGGVWEWCDSPHEEGGHVLRGGAMNSPAIRCRSAQRNLGLARTVDKLFGVRLVLEKG